MTQATYCELVYCLNDVEKGIVHSKAMHRRSTGEFALKF